MKNTKMYILVRERAPRGWAINGVGHAALLCYLKFKDKPEMLEWVLKSFRKKTCIVSDEEYELAKTAGDYVEFIEDDLDNMRIAIAFKPREKYPCYFAGFRLYS